MKPLKTLAFIVLFCAGIAPVVAQALDCPAIVRQALETASAACDGTKRNQACYGNIQLTVQAQDNAPAITFEKPGDTANLTDIKSMQLEQLDAQKNVWGIVLMRVQANLPDTLPGQNVTFLLFGNVTVTNAGGSAPVKQPVLLDVTAPKKVNIRQSPSTSAAVVGSLDAKTTLKTDGRIEDGSWVRVQLPDSTLGWVFTSLVKVNGDVSTLEVVDPNAPAATTPTYGPMQAFYFKTGISDAPCEQAPDSGLLIQTPEGGAEVDLQMNGVNVKLGSTAYVQAQPGGEMTINLIEGKSQVESAGVTRTLPEGTRVRVPLDANLQAAGAPSQVEPYDDSKFQALPTNLLPRKITVAPALTADKVNVSLPTNGLWKRTYHNPTQVEGTCIGAFGGNGGGDGGDVDIPPIAVCGAKLPDKPVYITVERQAYPYIFGSDNIFGSSRLPFYDARTDQKTGETIGTITTIYTDEYQVVAPDKIEVTITGKEIGGCTTTTRVTLDLVSADESVCSVDAVSKIVADAEQSSQVSPEPMVKPGKYTFERTPMPDCTAEVAPPSVDEATVSVDANQYVTIQAGDQTYHLYPMGSGLYQYSSGFGSQQLHLSMYINADASLNLSWYAYKGSAVPCSMSITMKPVAA